MTDTRTSLQRFVVIKLSKILDKLLAIDTIVTEHPERMVFDLTVRIGQEFERTVANRNAAFKSILHLAFKKNLCDLVLIVVFIFLFTNKYDPGKVVKLAAVLPNDIVRLLSLQG